MGQITTRKQYTPSGSPLYVSDRVWPYVLDIIFFTVSETNTNTGICSTGCHKLWCDGYDMAGNSTDTAAREMHDSLYKRIVFTIL
jgi:hypothetical protein